MNDPKAAQPQQNPNFVQNAVQPVANRASDAMTNIGNLPILKMLGDLLMRNSEGGMGKPTNTRAFKSSEMTQPYKGSTANSTEVKKYNK